MNLPLASIDWTNAVIIPILIGIPLAIYTGLVATRVFAFFQMRYRAVTWLYELKEVLEPNKDRQTKEDFMRGTSEQYPGPHDFIMAVGQSALPLLVEIRALGHEKLRQHVAAVYSRFQSRAAELLHVPLLDNALPQFPEVLSPLPWLEFMDSMRQFHLASLRESLVQLTTTKPDRWSLLAPTLFPNYLSSGTDFDGLLIARSRLRKRRP